MLSSLIHKTDKKSVCTNSFHESFSPVLVMAQCLAMLPVMGVRNASASGLKFMWQSFRTIYSSIACGFAATYLILTIYAIFDATVTFDSFGLCERCLSVNFFKFKSHINQTFSFHCSSIDFLHDNHIWCAQFHFISKEMAKTNATLAVC